MTVFSRNAPTLAMRQSYLFGLAGVILLLVVSISIRFKHFNNYTGAPNLEATYHVLLTMHALSQQPVKAHYYLPTVTLGEFRDTETPWGATRPSRMGNYIYTSFSPAGFIVPFAFAQMIGKPPSLELLIWFNLILQFISAFLLFHILFKLTTCNHMNNAWLFLVPVVGTSVIILSKEALLSFGLVYWCHQLWMPVFLLQLCLLLSILEKYTNFKLILFAVASFFTAYVEWSGFVLNGLLWIACCFVSPLKRLGLRPSFGWTAFFSSVLAAMFIVVHFALVIGLKESLSSFLTRSSARSLKGNATDIAASWINSYGLLPIVPLLVFSFYFLAKKYLTEQPHTSSIRIANQPSGDPNKSWLRPNKLFFAILFSSVLPSFENLIMTQHAIQFSFDRLKLGVPVAILVVGALLFCKPSHRVVISTLIAVSLLLNVFSYLSSLTPYNAWKEIHLNNTSIKNNLAPSISSDNSAIFSSFPIRGYTNLLFMRNIQENTSLLDATEYSRNHPETKVIYLKGSQAFVDMPKISDAFVIRDGKQISAFKAPNSPDTFLVR